MKSATNQSIAFTVCSSDSLAYALALSESFSRHHGEARFYVALSDSGAGPAVASTGITLLRLADLGLPDAHGMAARYGPTEFQAALRPFAFQVLFDRHPGSSVLYLAPEAFVVSRFDELLELIAEGAECVLTPAITEPAEHAPIDDLQVLRTGVYGSAFCCLADTPSVRRVVWWWARRLESPSLVDHDAGLLIDHRWTDLFPAFIERTRILRHPGYNVGYRNLTQRLLRRTEDGWSVNGMPLRCFDFSGSDGEGGVTSLLQGISPEVRRAGPASELLAEFRGTLLRHGHGRLG